MGSVSAKEILFGVVAIGLGILNAFIWKQALIDGEFRSAAFYSFPVIALFAFTLFFCLSAAFIRHGRWRTGVAVLSLVSGLLFVPFSLVVASVGLLIMIGGWYSSRLIHEETSESSRFLVRKVFRGGLPLFFTAVTILLALFYYLSIEEASTDVFLPKVFFDAALPILERPLGAIVPGFRSEASVDEFILSFILSGREGAMDLASLPPEERERFTREAREAFSREFGLELGGEERGSDVLYQVTNAKIEEFLGEYRRYVPVIAAIGFFIAIKALTLPLYWLTLLLMFLVVRFLIAIGVVKKQADTVEVERMVLS